jgi:hypothetical protein
MNDLDKYRAAALALADAAEDIAGIERINPGAVVLLIAKEAKNIVGDGRKNQWRVRVRFYSAADDYAEPIADTDPDAEAGLPGATILSGLPALVDWIAQLGVQVHGQQPNGLATATLDHRLKAFRPTLSRCGGLGVWRIPYSTLEKIGEHTVEKHWKARADVARIEVTK